MTILIHRIDGRTFQFINGHARLRASLEVFGKATVTDAETNETFEVHEVDGQLVVLSDGHGQAAETIAATVIKRAAKSSVECPMCGGTGGWPGFQGHVTCRPCNGTGRSNGTETF